MSYLLDTNVVSEWTRPRPDPGVISWLSEVDEDRVFISVITFAELRHGIERLPQGRRRQQLAEWLEDDLPQRFEQRVLAVDEDIAHEWGRTIARCESAGRALSAMDALIAATATVNAMTLVTRNSSDFKHSVKELLNPWTGKT